MTYILYLFILLILINLYFYIAKKFKIVDKPNLRSSHSREVIRGGGVIFPIGLILWFFWSGFQYPWFVLGLVLISIISIVDDISHTHQMVRLPIHFLAILFLLFQAGLSQGEWWIWIVAVIAATAVINVYNFMDGINGITAGYSFSVLTALWLVNIWIVHFVENELIIATGLALVVFSFYNFRSNAKCFAGDVGSVSISFILVFLIANLIIKSGSISYIMLLVVYGVDSSLTILQRLTLGENIFKPHRRHLYQILANEKGIPHLYISLGYTLVQLLINAIMLLVISRYSPDTAALTGAAIILLLCGVYILVKWNILKNQTLAKQQKPIDPNQ